MRILHELDSWEASCFVTLTYRPDQLPYDGDLVKSHMQNFFKRLRLTLGERKIKYYACGEYGSRYGRPHYHAIIFGIGPNDYDMIDESWGLGLVHIGTVTRESAQYVASYIHDKLTGDVGAVFGHKKKPFQLQSKGLGKNYLLENKDKILYDAGISYHGRVYSMPRYYTKLLGDLIVEDDKEMRMRERSDVSRSWLEEHGIDPLSEATYRIAQRAQKAEEDKTRIARKSRKL